MKPLCLRFGLLAVLAGCCHAGPLTPLFLTDGDNQLLWRIDGNHATPFAAVFPGEYPIATNQTIRTMGLGAGTTLAGSEYGFDGTPTGATYSNPLPTQQMYDGTADEHYNYAVQYTGFANAIVYRFNADWSNPFPLFPTTFNGGYLGIAYDPRDRSFWLGTYSDAPGSRIEHWSIEGQLLGGFNTNLPDMGFLALDPADFTLWTFSQDDPTALYQFSTGGAAMEVAHYDAFAAADDTPNLLGGEFAPLATSVPEPATGPFLVGISVMLAVWLRWWGYLPKSIQKKDVASGEIHLDPDQEPAIGGDSQPSIPGGRTPGERNNLARRSRRR